MIDPLTGGVVVAGGILTAHVAYSIGKSRSEDTGCNGHHWGEPETAITEDDLTTENPIQSVSPYETKRLSADALSEGVYLRTDATKTCSDCGETKDVKTTLGTVDYGQFFEDDE